MQWSVENISSRKTASDKFKAMPYLRRKLYPPSLSLVLVTAHSRVSCANKDDDECKIKGESERGAKTAAGIVDGALKSADTTRRAGMHINGGGIKTTIYYTILFTAREHKLS